MSSLHSAEARAIAAAGLKAGILSSLCLASLGTGLLVLSSSEIGFYEVYAGLWIAAAAFMVASIFGTLAVIFGLLLFGWPLAGLARKHLAGPIGLAIAITAATITSAMIAWAYGDIHAIWFILLYAIPAAIFYRQEILLERIFD